MLSLLALGLLAVDPHRLPIGAPGEVTIGMGGTIPATGQRVTMDEVAQMADGVRFVVIGESHDRREHRVVQAELIEALVRRGRDVVVGMEMFSFQNDGLAGWSLGRWDRERFLMESDWQNQWGFDFALYEPVFEAVRRHRLPLFGINVPRLWVRAVSRQGWESLNDEQRAAAPHGLDLGNREHRQVFEALIGGHPMGGGSLERMYSAQVYWDEAMAHQAWARMSQRFSSRAVMVLVVGSGHMLYGQGVGWRLRQRYGAESLGVLCLDSDGEKVISRGIADVVWAVPDTP